jgi:hypothetical protein
MLESGFTLDEPKSLTEKIHRLIEVGMDYDTEPETVS